MWNRRGQCTRDSQSCHWVNICLAVHAALVFSDPHTQNVLPAVQVNANSDVYRLLHDLALAADMVVDRVQKHYGVDPLQRPLLPLPHDGQNLVRDPAHGAV